MLALRDIREWVAGFGISEDAMYISENWITKRSDPSEWYRRKGSGPSGNGPGGRSTVQLRCPGGSPFCPLGAGPGSV